MSYVAILYHSEEEVSFMTRIIINNIFELDYDWIEIGIGNHPMPKAQWTWEIVGTVRGVPTP